MSMSKSTDNSIIEFILKPNSQCECQASKNTIKNEFKKNDTSVKLKFPDITREQRFWDKAVPS